MSKPAVLTKLVEGKLIGSQKGFVSTFNFLVDFISNLRGDAECDDGAISVDRSIEDFPVVRLKGGAGGGGGGGSSSGGSFSYVDGYITAGAICIGRQYIRVQGMGGAGDGEYRVVIDMAGRTGRIELGSGFVTPTKSETYVPLFLIANGEVVEDYRAAAMAQAWEDYEDPVE